MNIKNENYIQISGWMINELDLKGNELLVYALIHGFCQDGKSVFKGSLNYIMSWLNISKPTCIACIQSLIDKGMVVKTIIYNKNSVAGCEYYTKKSRCIESETQKIPQNVEKGGKEFLPPQNEKESEGSKEILPPQNEKELEGGKEFLPGWSKYFTRGGKEILPNNTNDNAKYTATADKKFDFEELCDKYFGKNAFDSDFPRKAAAFFSKNKINDCDLYFSFIKNKLIEKQNIKHVNNPRGLAYRLFFQSDIAQEFKEQQQLILLEKQKEDEKQRKIEARKITCPCCGKIFLPDYISSCPECDFDIDSFGNTEKVRIHKNYLKLTEQQKTEYQKELKDIYFSENYFAAFINGLKSLNYIVDYRVLCAADYGAATSRKRLFIQAIRKDCGKKILWPKPTNTQGGDLLLPAWHSASEIIDWNYPCQILSQRKKPLAEATMRRIEYGIREYWGEAAVPFIARLYGQSKAESIEKPLSTISCSGAHHMLITPFITAIGQTSAKQRNRKVSEPLSTICTKQEHCLVQPMLVQYYGNGHAVSIQNPVPTLTTKDRYALVGTDRNGIELGFRMLQPHELAAATGFPSDYKFTGSKAEVVKQIGNAVPPNFAKAMFSQILSEMTA